MKMPAVAHWVTLQQLIFEMTDRPVERLTRGATSTSRAGRSQRSPVIFAIRAPIIRQASHAVSAVLRGALAFTRTLITPLANFLSHPCPP